MRRGASLSEQNAKKQPVMADLHDLEGGVESPAKTYIRASSGDSYHSASSPGSMELAPLVSPNDYTGKDKRTKGGGKAFSKISHAYLTSHSFSALKMYTVVLAIGTGIICPFLSIEWCILTLVFSSCAFGMIASLWLARSVLQCDDGTPEMRAVSDPIREGAEGFLRVQYSAIAKFAGPLALLIVASYQFRPHQEGEIKGVAVLGNAMLGAVAAMGFVAGAICSAVSGYTAMWVAAQSNIRVASAGRRSYGEALVVCFRGGAFSAVLNLTLCIVGKCYYCLSRLTDCRHYGSQSHTIDRR
jgi:hypothetical protein